MTQEPGRHLGDDPTDQTQALDRESLDRESTDEQGHGERTFDERSFDEQASVTRHEERAHVGTELTESGSVQVRKHVETYPVTEVVPRNIEHADTSERVPAVEGDSGEVETLEDGSISIPVFEEVLVVTKRLVVRERVIVRKRTVIDEYTLQTELQREHVTVEGDVDDVDDPDRGAGGVGGLGGGDGPGADRTADLR